MQDRTLTAMYDSAGAAEAARDALVAAIPSASVSVHGNGGTEEGGGLWDTLKSMFFPDEDRATYGEGLRRGGYLLAAEVPAGFEEQALDVLEQSNAVDVDERSAGWRAEGWDAAAMAGIPGGSSGTVLPNAGRAETTTGGVDAATAATVTSDASLADTVTRPAAATPAGADETIPVVEEDLRVGKREVGRGSVRVRSYVTERPVEEQVALRQEHVTLERRPVDRELSEGEAAFQERTIEAVERGEEPVVSKTARVVEEVGVRKDVERDVETVRDNVRRTEVEVEDDRAADGLRTTTADRPS